MSYASVSEADTGLAHSAAWTALDADTKERHLATAALWLNFSYDWPGCIASCPADTSSSDSQALPLVLPFTLTVTDASALTRSEWPRVDCCTGEAITDTDGCPISGIPFALKQAQIIAAGVSVTTPLFSVPTTVDDGGLTKKRIKVGSIEIERNWSEPTTGSEGQLVLTQVDAVLMKIGKRRGVSTGRLMDFL